MITWTCPAGSFQGFESQTCNQLRGIRYATSERFCEPVSYRYSDGVHSCLDKSPYAVQLATLDRLPLTRRIIENALEKKGDEIFASPSRAFAKQYANAGGQCGYYDYYWTQNSPVIGACHCHELVPLLGGKSLEGLDIMMGLSEDDVRKAGKQIRRLWTEFARTGIIQNTQIDDMLTLTKQ